jgi:hypothetical protein
MRWIAIPPLLVVALVQAGPAVASEHGEIRGRVVEGGTGAPRERVPVVLVMAAEGSGQDIMRTRTDVRGRFEFRDLQRGEGTSYVLIARYAGGQFARGPMSLFPDEDVQSSNVRVWETTTDPAAISLARDAIFVVPNQGQVSVIESIVVVNKSARAYIGRGDRDERRGWMYPTLGLALPARAEARDVQVLESSIPILNVVPTDFGAGITSAIPPGETRLTFVYRLPGLVGSYDLSRTALYGARDVSVYAADPFEISSNRLDRSEAQRIGGKTYRVWSTKDLVEAGDPIQIRATAEAGAGPAVIGGIVAGSLVAALAVFAGARRLLKRRSGRAPASSPASSEQSPSTRRDLVAAIAELDLRYRRGEIPEAAWRTKRTKLKSHLSATVVDDATKSGHPHASSRLDHDET